MIEFLESNPDAFHVLWLGGLIIMLTVLFVAGRKAEEKFGDLSQQVIRFREKYASGRSHKSLLAKSGGASRMLDVIVTDRELWIKGIWPAFTYIGSRFDLSRRVPLERVSSAQVDGSRAFLMIRDELGSESKIELALRNPVDFVQALRDAS